MFERIKNSIRSLLSKVIWRDEDIEKLIRELQRDLILADIDLKIVKEIVNEVKSRIEKDIDKRQAIIWSLYETISKYMGKGEKITIEKTPFKIMLVGLFGSGKTTTAAKIAYYFKKKGYKVALIQTDKYRPASFEQLKQLGDKTKVKVFDFRENLEKFREIEKNFEVFIIDTAGRTVLDDFLVNEIKDLKNFFNPDKIILVLPAEVGQNAKREIEGFQKFLNINGIIIARMDGSAKGGGALVASYLTNAPVFFVGVGERIEDLEEFNPKGFVGRLLGIGDIEGLLRKIEEELKNKEEIERKIKEGRIDLYFLKEQIENMEKLGPIDKLLQMIPGFGLMNIEKSKLDLSKEKIKKFKAIFNSLRKIEFEKPELIRKRLQKIAYGAGVSEQDVLDLLNMYHQMRKILKLTKRRDFQRLIQKYMRFGF